jgi:hypothetical protein
MRMLTEIERLIMTNQAGAGRDVTDAEEQAARELIRIGRCEWRPYAPGEVVLTPTELGEKAIRIDAVIRRGAR